MAGTVVVFDFDRTIIDPDSDRWVIFNLGAGDLFHRLRSTLPWTSLMDRMVGELHSQGKTIDDITDCLKKIPLDPRIIAAIKSAHSLGCDLRVASDANLFYIETILKHHGVMGCFSEIYTNPSYIDEEGKLRIRPYNTSPHGCSLCRANMCKGKIIERIRGSGEEKKRFIYLGDGGGDYCAALKLNEGDSVMPRMSYPLWNLIHENAVLVKGRVHGWTDGGDLERILLQLVGGGDTSVSKHQVECKLETMPMAMGSPEGLSPALTAPLTYQ